MKNIRLNHKQAKAMGKVIKEFGGSKKIKAMPLEEKLIVMKEIELAKRGLPTGPVKLLTPDNMMEVAGVEFAMDCKTPKEKEEINKKFDKLVERIEVGTEVLKKVDKRLIKPLIKAFVGAVGMITAATLTLANSHSAVAMIGAIIGAICIPWAITDLIKINKTENKELAKIESM